MTKQLQKPTNSKFTNNTDPNTLLNRFRDIITNDSVKIAHLSFLIGFFRASGFRHLWDLISPKIAQFQSIRILVGLNADLQTAEINTLTDDLARNPHL